jgi:hypothetical protein
MKKLSIVFAVCVSIFSMGLVSAGPQEEMLKKLVEQVAQGFASMETNFKAVGTRLDGLNGRLDRAEVTVADLKQRVDQKHDILLDRVTALEQKSDDNHNAVMRRLTAFEHTIEQRFTKMGDAAKQRYDQLKEHITQQIANVLGELGQQKALIVRMAIVSAVAGIVGAYILGCLPSLTQLVIGTVIACIVAPNKVKLVASHLAGFAGRGFISSACGLGSAAFGAISGVGNNVFQWWARRPQQQEA